MSAVRKQRGLAASQGKVSLELGATARQAQGSGHTVKGTVPQYPSKKSRAGLVTGNQVQPRVQRLLGKSVMTRQIRGEVGD